jgi:1-acyl-sn-glycerol-3-phosphate acyltransferase
MADKIPRKLFRLCHSFFLIIWVVFSVIIFGILTDLTRVVSRRLAMWVTRTWLVIVIFFSGIKMNVHGLEKLDRKRDYIFMANHVSALDIPILQAALPFRTAFMAKKELFYIPFFGWGIAVSGHIPVDRKNPSRARKSMERAVTALRTGRNSLIVFPEGTRSKTGELGPFKLGVFSIAVEAGANIVPIALKGTHRILPKGSFYINPMPVTVQIGEPVSSSGFDRKNKSVLARLVRDRIEDMLA